MAEEKILRETLEDVKRKLMVMEWDKARNQLNSGKLGIYNELNAQKLKIETELLQSVESENPVTAQEANSTAEKTD